MLSYNDFFREFGQRDLHKKTGTVWADEKKRAQSQGIKQMWAQRKAILSGLVSNVKC